MKKKFPLKNIWFQALIEVVVVIAFGLFHIFLTKILPKRWRPRLDTVKSISDDVASVAENLPSKDDTIFALIGKGQNIFHIFWEKIYGEETPENVFKEYVSELKTADGKGYELHADSTFVQSVIGQIEKLGDVKIVCVIDQENRIVRHHFSYNVGEQKKVVDLYLISGSSRELNAVFAAPTGFNYYELVNILFSLHGPRLYMSVDRDGVSQTIPLSHQMDYSEYIPETALMNSLNSEIQRFNSQGKQRSYLLNGPPGCGKTTFCLQMCAESDGKIIKIDSSVFSHLGSQTVKLIIENLDVSYILVDDIDRIYSSDISTLLYCLEAIKTYKNKPTLLATCNNIFALEPAVIRPGRFDDIIEFELMNEDQRKTFIEKMLVKIEFSLTEEQIAKFVELSTEMTQAYLKEYILQLKLEGDFEKTMTKLIQRRKYLEPDWEPATNTRKQQEGDDPVLEASSSKKVSKGKKIAKKSLGHADLVSLDDLLNRKTSVPKKKKRRVKGTLPY
jgi:hypothetical protein